MYVCMCARVRIHMCILCVFVHTDDALCADLTSKDDLNTMQVILYIYIDIHTHTHVCVQAYIRVYCVYSCICRRICLHSQQCGSSTHTHTYLHTHTYTHNHLQPYLFFTFTMWLFHNIHIHTYTYVYIHIHMIICSRTCRHFRNVALP